MRKIMTLAALAAALGASLALAAMKGSADVVQASPAKAKVTAAAGAPVDFAVNLAIAPSWHIYAHGDTNFIGVDLVPGEGFPLEGFAATYPAGHEGEFFGEKVVTIAGDDVIKVRATVPAGLAKGEHKLAFDLTVQACDDKTRLAPAKVPVELMLTVK